MRTKLAPIHPGEILVEEFLEPLQITPYRLAKELRVPQPRIYAITKGERAITADTAMRLAKFFGTSDEFWMNLQLHYDLEIHRDGDTRNQIAKIELCAALRELAS